MNEIHRLIDSSIDIIIDSRINRRTLGLWDSFEYVSRSVAQCYREGFDDWEIKGASNCRKNPAAVLF